MSKKRKLQRAHHSEQERKKGEKLVKLIIGVLLALAVFYMVYMTILMS